ncbi:MAG: TRAM domain-containing protein [Polyangiaceae bacterium]
MTTSPPCPETIEVLRIAPGGDGVGRLASGEAIFVPGTARGDRVEITASKRLQGVLIAQAHRVLEPSADRKDPPCPWAERCGGCDFMHLRSEVQRREKLAMLDDALVRIGGNPARPDPVEWIASETDWPIARDYGSMSIREVASGFSRLGHIASLRSTVASSHIPC